jgi:hypothetical protein
VQSLLVSESCVGSGGAGLGFQKGDLRALAHSLMMRSRSLARALQQMEGAHMKLVGSMYKKFGPTSHASIVVEENGGHWWFFHPPAIDLEAARKRYLPNGPFNSVEEAEEHFRDTILGGEWPKKSSTIQRRKR